MTLSFQNQLILNNYEESGKGQFPGEERVLSDQITSGKIGM